MIQKITLSIALAILSIMQAYTQTIQIGNGTSTTSYLPIYASYGYTYSQQIVLASEYSAQNGTAGNITKLRFYLSNGSLSTNSENWTIYLGHTTKTNFTSNTDWVPFTNLTSVFSGTVAASSGNWMEITLSTPFNYNGTDNIVVAIDENSPGYQFGISWRKYTASNDRAIYYRSDSNNPNPNSPPTANSLTSTLAQIQFEGVLASCLTPTNLGTSNMSATSASLNWTENNNAAYWQISYGTSSFIAGNGTNVTANSNPFNLTTLSANTNYEWYVRSICGVGGTSTWAGPFSFTTACASFTAPYTQNFDGTSEPDIDPCWNKIEEVTGSYYESVETYDGSYPSAYSAPNSIAMSNNYNTPIATDMLALVSPHFSDFDNTKRIRFYAYDKSGTSDLIVGTITDPSNSATFTAFQTITAASMPDDTWAEHMVSFANYTGTDKYIVLKHGLGTASDYIYIDNFVYENIPSCIKPNTLSFSSITASSANLSWISGGSGESQWEIYVTTNNVLPTSSTTPTFTANTNPFNVTGLTASSSYKIYVRAVCSASDKSQWSSVAELNTLCADVDLSLGTYCENFESNSAYITAGGCNTVSNIDVCWTSTDVSGGNHWMVSRGNAYYPEEDRFDDEDGQFAHLGTASYQSCYGKTSLLTSPIFHNLSSIANPAIEFYYFMKNGNYTPKQNLLVEITTDGGTTWSTLWQKSGPLTNDDDWNKAIVSIPATYHNASNIQIRFNGTTGRWYGQSIAIDDICIKDILCGAISGTDVQTACDSYTWIDGNTYNASNNSATYTISGGASNGCDSIVSLNLTITEDYEVVVNNNKLMVTPAADTYQWINCTNNEILAGETNQKYTATTNGTYAAIVTTGNCTDTTTCIAIKNVGIETTAFGKLHIYPNPAQNKLNIIFEENSNEASAVAIINILGKKVFEEKNVTKNILEINTSELTNGIYYIKITSTNREITQSILIRK